MITYQIAPDLNILFVGSNPHPGSYRRGVPFSNNKMFWYLLHDAGLITEPRYLLRDDVELKKLYYEHFITKYGFGSVDMVDRPTRTAIEVTNVDALPGKKRLEEVIRMFHPRVVCFVSKATYRLFNDVPNIQYGWQEPINASQIYVMHSPTRGAAIIRINELQEILKMVS